jgi:hypothetical protein
MGVMRTILTLLTLTLVCLAGSCGRMQRRSGGTDLLSTGLVGWQQIGGGQDAWRFQDGILYTAGGNGGWLATIRQFDDFRLSLEFRVPPGGNSGVFIRSPLEGDPAYTGMEIQILDDYAEPYRSLNPYQYTGSIYDVQAPSERATKHAGKWQKMVVTARGPQIEVAVNGQKVVDTNVNYYPYKASTHPGLKREGGFIGLQNHGSRVEFRNIRIQEQ